MSVQRFVAATTRAAMQQVRASLGEDALLLANRATDDGVEIIAMADDDAKAITGLPSPDATPMRALATVNEAIALPSPRRASEPPPPIEASFWQRLRVAGFSRTLGQTLLAEMPESVAGNWLASQLRARLKTAEAGALARARVVLLVGPPGVGKTTMAAKLAADHALHHGPDGVALLNTDTATLGARAVIDAHARALHIDLHTLEVGQDLGQLAAELQEKNFIVIDTPGFGSGDPALAAHLRRLCSRVEVLPVLVLGAAQSAEVMDDTAHGYRTALATVGVELADAVVAGKDQAPRLGPVLDVLIRHGLRLHHVGDGRHVTADFASADGAVLIDAALAASAREEFAEAMPEARQLVRHGQALGATWASLRGEVHGLDRLERSWNWRGLPVAEQRRQADACAAEGNAHAHAWYWQGDGKTVQAVQALDAAGLPQVDACPRPVGAELATALAGAADTYRRGVHHFDRRPQAEAWHWLSENRVAWTCRARANTKVWHAGEHLALQACRTLAEPAGDVALQWRGRAVLASLRRLPVAMPIKRGKASALLEAWFAELRDRNTGTLVAVRCWLVAGASTSAADLLATHLRIEELPALAGKAGKLLAAQTGVVAGTATTTLAAGLAALACRLDAADEGWALAMRAPLLNLAGLRCRRGAAVLIEALLVVFGMRDALREIGAAVVLH